MDDTKSFFSRLCACDSAKTSSSQSGRRQCKSSCNQKSFVSNLWDKISEKSKCYKEKEGKCSESVKKEEKCEPKREVCKENTKKLCPEAKKPKAACKTCFIKEQNPLAPPCCRLKSEAIEENSTCPPQGSLQDYRAPTCGCDLCQKSGYSGRCYDRRTFAEDPPQLERA